ncbi:MAG TPA: SOS response-associated peptidase [Polyangiaceae bacterium]|jgi:putative SOS response-associated peptidase YedK|nr:SOS response-associated peptidase [Polyangiaceae bacterium]
MCGRAALTASPDDLRDIFGLDEAPDPSHLAPHYNIPPSQPLGVVRVVRGDGDAGTRGRTLQTMRWGLVPPWAKDPKIGHKLVLARAETVAHAGAFREAFLQRRCLVAVDGFYEWKRSAVAGTARGGKTSAPYLLRRPDHKPFALAGLWSRWVSGDGEVVESCAILTQAARAPVDAIHDRMPVILAPADWDAWLDPALAPDRALEALEPLLVPRDHSPADLVALAVSSYVNDPRHDDARCVAPAPTEQRSLF